MAWREAVFSDGKGVTGDGRYIIKEIGVLSENAKGWRKELNLISWNGGAAKYDIRDWAPDHEKMGKGTTLTEEEMENLKEILGLIEPVTEAFV